MIVDELNHLKFYAARDPRLEIIDRFLRECPPETLADGRVDLPEGICALTADRPTRAEGPYEAHRRYADLHLVIRGSEVIEWAPLEQMPGDAPYDAEGDCLLFDADAADSLRVPLTPGRFLIAWPQDAHKPLIRLRDGACRKVIFKIPVQGGATQNCEE